MAEMIANGNKLGSQLIELFGLHPNTGEIEIKIAAGEVVEVKSSFAAEGDDHDKLAVMLQGYELVAKGEAVEILSGAPKDIAPESELPEFGGNTSGVRDWLLRRFGFQ